MKVLITGTAGFIGYHLAKRLIREQLPVIGLDNLNPYYDPALKNARLEELRDSLFTFIEAGIQNMEQIHRIFESYKPDVVVHLAAQAGVRYSLDNPQLYLETNVLGFGNVLEACRKHQIGHLIYASSSSVYGANTETPFSVGQMTDHPVSLYGATKKANELMAYSYSHLFGLSCTGLRFFTVYGPWGRPDMAYFSFTKSILEGTPIKVFNHGNMMRDFTYIDDVVEAVFKLLDRKPAGSPPHRVFNVGNNNPIRLSDMIGTLEETLGRKAIRVNLPMQPGDVLSTYADIDDLTSEIGFRPFTKFPEGICRFVEWYKAYYNIK